MRRMRTQLRGRTFIVDGERDINRLVDAVAGGGVELLVQQQRRPPLLVLRRPDDHREQEHEIPERHGT